ncbi:hypothetical protein JX265_000713 [Neoarthrinium moseri]|uniref:RNA helicase n=1 Tax=Neoarthrinium moseri TaxID=1658444 RepID=A0A9P9WZ30_9PEZI|nr:hypothetical protein JX265_000713 [Neoarthrinium moseri]
MSGWGNDTAPEQPAAAGWGNGADTRSGDNGDGLGASEEKPAPPPLPWEHREAPKSDWVKKTAYNYANYNDDGAGAPDVTVTTVDWESNAQVYHYDGEEGDVGPVHTQLETILFGNEDERDPTGIDFTKISIIDVLQEGLTRINPINSFDTAGLHPIMLRNVQLCGYQTPTPIQRYCIPAVKMGHDIIAIAQTGSGKTAAYLIPILNQLMGKAKKLAAPRPNPVAVESGAAPPVTAEPLVVIVCPARELAVQIFNEARKFCYRTMLRPAVIYGGSPIREQIGQLQKGCDVLVATPGRLIDMMERPHVLSLRRVRYMVIDEADEMLHSDWEEEFNKILSGGEQEEGNIKYMLFSATFPTQVRKLAKDHLANTHVRIRVGRIGSTHVNIEQKVIWVDPFMKKTALLDLLYDLEPGRSIIFVNNKRVADELDDFLFNKDLPCTSMHSDRTQREREDSMRAFRSGTTPILITTGVSARGIDVKNVKHVINYDLPRMDHGGITEYTHRIGRTARIGHRGKAFSFYNEHDEAIAEVLTKTLLETNQDIPDFLQKFVPEGEDREHLKFEPGSDEESEAGDAGGAGGWGGDLATDGGGWNTGGDSKPAVADDAGEWGGAGANPSAGASGNDTWGGGGGFGGGENSAW